MRPPGALPETFYYSFLIFLVAMALLTIFITQISLGNNKTWKKATH